MRFVLRYLFVSKTEMDFVILAMINEMHYEEDMQKYFLFKKWRDESQEELIVPTLIFSSSLVHTRAPDYYEDWLPQYLERDFFNLFRMTKDTFLNLLVAIDCPERQFGGGEQPVTFEKCLLMCLWWLGKGETLISVSGRFNVALSTTYNSIEYVIPKILQLQSKYILWPTPEEAVNIETAFKEKSGYPGVIGAIDGCNIRFKCPNDQQESYINKNRNHSIKLQRIVTANKILTNIMVGFPGSAHDSRVLQNSKIFVDIQDNGMIQKYFTNQDYHLLGDKAYPLKKWLLTPYKDERHLDDRQRYHNITHSKTRIVVEHTFGILKSRWRILELINVNSIEKAIKIVAACCILHNFCYVHWNMWNEFEAIPNEYVQQHIINFEREGMLKRDNIATNLWREYVH